MRIKLGLTFIFIVGILFLSQAQYRPQRSGGSLSDKIYFGGGGGFSGGTQFLSLSISPLIGYKITEQFSAGLQITYQYQRFQSLSASNFGGGPFLLYAFTPKFFAYSQYEYMSVQRDFSNAQNSNVERLDFTSFFAGLGYNEPIGGNVSFQILALYNLIYGDGTSSPYDSPLQFRVGIVAGF